MTNQFSYRLSPEFIQTLENEFPIAEIIEEFKKSIENGSLQKSATDSVLSARGRDAAKMICDLESDYRDRNAEVIYMIAEKTGHAFPSIQQRLIEIAYLALMNENQMKFREISFKQISYGITRCVMFEKMVEILGEEVAKQLPCSDFCMELLKGICDGTSMKDLVVIEMLDKITGHHSRCLFSAQLTLDEQLRLTNG